MQRFENSKKLRIIIVAFIAVMVVFFGINLVLAQDNTGLQQIGTSVGFGSTSLVDVIFNIIRVFIGFLGIIAVVLVIYGGYLFMTSGGDSNKVEKGRKLLINAGIGLGIILMSYAIVSFIFGLFGAGQGSQTGFGPAFNGGGYEGGTGALGGGIIQSHYPSRGALDVPRNTSIIITFKEEVDVVQIINNSGKLSDEVFSIFPIAEPANKITNIDVTTSDNKTFVMKPLSPLGSPDTNVDYTVGISNSLKKADGTSAFGNLASSGDFAYQWSFQTSTKLDLKPPHITSVIPIFSNDAELSVPRNIIVQVNFSEPVNPITISGIVEGGSDDYEIIQTQSIEEVTDSATGVVTTSLVDIQGVYSFGNEYKTVEFVTNVSCGINSCGNEIYCLPADANISVFVNSASLIDKTSETPFQALAIGGKYDGVVDLAGNALDGNKDTIADENSNFFDVNDTDTPDKDKLGDNYKWSFWTNNVINITAPLITDYSPLAGQEEVDPNQFIVANFDKPLSKSSIKPDSNYGDGFCICSTDANCNADQRCSVVNKYCIDNEDSKRIACYTYLPDTCNLFRDPAQPTEKSNINEICKQLEHVTINQDKALEGRNPNDATWYSPYTTDYITDNINESYSSVYVKHGRFLDQESYGVNYGSGIKDIYQNCYTPNSAPGCERVTVGDGTYTADTNWSGVFPSCDLIGESLTTKGQFNISYENTKNQNILLPVETLSWDQPASNIFDSNGNLNSKFNFFNNLTDDNTVNIAFYHDKSEQNNSSYYLILTSNYSNIKSNLTRAVNPSSDTLILKSVNNFPEPEEGLTESVLIGGVEITYSGINVENNTLTGVSGIDGDFEVGMEVIYKSAGTIKFTYLGTTKDEDQTFFNSIGNKIETGEYNVTLKWDNKNDENKSYMIHDVAVDDEENNLLELTITPKSSFDIEYLEKMKLRVIYPGGILELPRDKVIKIIQTSL